MIPVTHAPDFLLSVEEAAKYYDCHPMSFRTFEREGLKFFVAGRRSKLYSQAELDRFSAARHAKKLARVQGGAR